MSYRNLEIWQIAREVSVEIHKMTLNELPKFEMYETGSQIRRSSKSIRSNIVEGYGRRRYKSEFIHFLTYSIASCDETIDHLECLFETESLRNRQLYGYLHDRLDTLGRKLNSFISSVDSQHLSMRDDGEPYEVHPAADHPASSIQHPASSIQQPASISPRET